MLNKVILSSTFACLGTIVYAQPTNVLLINIDDLGWTDLGFQGSEYYETPNIDKLRSEGMFFPQAYAGAANSAPSRASMMTGRFPQYHKVYTVSPSTRGKAKDRMLIPTPNTDFPIETLQLIPQFMKEQGYHTAHFGKWHLGIDAAQQGMDANYGGTSYGHPKSYFSPYRNDYLTDGPDGEYLTDRLGNDLSNYIANLSTDKPFFIYYAPYSVHTPLKAKPETIAKYEAKKGTEAHDNAIYAAMVETVDANIGKALKALKEKGLEENTLIILTSDNGGNYKVSRQWPLRAGKGSFYEGGIRVPFIAKWKGHIKPNTTNNTQVQQMDIYPTLAELVGSKGLVLDGNSLLKTFDQKKDKALKERPLFWHFPCYLEGGNKETTDPVFRSRPVSVVRKGDWKLIKNYENNKLELYNLKNDLREQNNLAVANEKKTKELVKILDQWLEQTDAPREFKLNPKYIKQL